MPIFPKPNSLLLCAVFSPGKYLYIAIKLPLNYIFYFLQTKQTQPFSFQTMKHFSVIMSVTLYPLKVLIDLFKTQALETFSRGQHQFHTQTLHYHSSSPFPIQVTHFCQIIILGAHVEMFGHCDLEIFSKSWFSRKQLLF